MKIKTKRYYIYYLARIGLFIIAILPIRLGLWLAGIGGRAFFILRKKDRKIAIENLKGAFPEKSDGEIERIVKEVFSNLCKNSIEWANIYKLTKETVDRWIKIEGKEKIDRALSQGKGLIMLTGHFGNWELISFYFLINGYPGSVIARRIYFDRYQRLIDSIRSSKGLRPIYRDESPKKILRLLKRNEILGILADQDMDSIDGVFVDFFRKPAYTPKAPVALALASGAALVPCFMIRQKDHHRLVVEDPIELVEKSNREETIKHNTQAWSHVLESYVKKYPEQWVWLHKRWKTKPQDEDKPIT